MSTIRVNSIEDLDGNSFNVTEASTLDFVQAAALNYKQTANLSVDNIAALRALSPTDVTNVQPLGYYTPGDGGGGPLRVWKTGAIGTYVDNGGSVIVPTGGDGSGAWVTYITDAIPWWDEGVDVLLVYGQSNAKGFANNTAGAPTYNNTLARVWNGSAFIPLTSYTPTPSGTSTGSAWAAFANEYCTKTGRGLVIVNGAKESSSISDLQKGGATYTGMSGWMLAALSALDASGVQINNKFIMFNQGERDSVLKTSPLAYGAALSQLWADIKLDFGMTLMGIYTVGYYATADMIHGQVIQQVQRTFSRDNDDVIIAYDNLGCFGSHNKLKVDTVHYTQRGYNIMGREGADRIVSALYPDSFAPASDELIERFGRLGIGQSQAWNLHSGVLRKAAGSVWTVNHTTPFSSSMIVSASELADRVRVKMACPTRSIMNYLAQVHGALASTGIKPVIGTGINPSSELSGVDVDGYSYADIFFKGDVFVYIDMINKTFNCNSMGGSGAGIAATLSVVFTSVGRVDITHPTIVGLAQGSIIGGVARTIRTNAASDLTILQTRDAADALVDDIVLVRIPNMPISPTAISLLTEVSLSIIAADYAVW